MSDALVVTTHALAGAAAPRGVPPVPWRDPHSVSRADLQVYIRSLEEACLARPGSADLRTCLGIAYAMNYEVYKSMDALGAAVAVDDTHFWAQLKFAELHYRLRALARAETETVKALDLAQSTWQLALARKQLQEIRRLNRESTRNITLDKPLVPPAVLLAVIMLVVFVGMTWRW